jgi:hypothetical protein
MIQALIKTDTLSAIYRDTAQVFFAGLFIEPIASGSIRPHFIFWGLLLSFGTWTFSLLLAKS